MTHIIANADATIHYVNGKLSFVNPRKAHKDSGKTFLWKIVPPGNSTEVCFTKGVPFDNWSGSCQTGDDEIEGHIASGASGDYPYSVRDIKNDIIIDPIIIVNA